MKSPRLITSAFDQVIAEIGWCGLGGGNNFMRFDALRGASVCVAGDTLTVTGIVRGDATSNYTFHATVNHATNGRSGPAEFTVPVRLGGPGRFQQVIDTPYVQAIWAKPVIGSPAATLNLYSSGFPGPAVQTFTGAVPLGPVRLSGNDWVWEIVNPGPESWEGFVWFDVQK
jgi:hypothetical protein